MSAERVAPVLRVDGIFNLIVGLVLQLYFRPALAVIGWPETETPVYAMVLGSALIGLSLAVLWIAPKPLANRSTIPASIIGKGLAGGQILYAAFVQQTFIPKPALLAAAVGAQGSVRDRRRLVPVGPAGIGRRAVPARGRSRRRR
ncbi:MAG: hypothetical protein WD040_07005 [Anaerolineales bacterium]